MAILDIASAVLGGGKMIYDAATRKQREREEDERQLRQQKKLQDIGIEGSKEMTDYQKQKELQQWKDTSYGAQVEQMNKAGVNPALLYGMGGSGGSTTGGGAVNVSGGSAADAASTSQARTGATRQSMDMAMAMAQMENIKADTKQKLATVEGTETTTEATKWNTDLSKKLNNDSMIKDIQDQQNWATQRLENTARRELMDWEAAEAAGFKDKDGKKYTWDDPESPVAKGIRAGYEETIEKVNNLKKEGNILESEKAIKQFEANLTRQGIAAGSPWYVKMVGDLLKKLGINLTGDTATVVKK